MKTNRIETETHTENESNSPFTSFCLNYCRKLITEIQKTKQQFATQFRNAFAGEEKVLRLALNEAEALAFLTDFPHLVFPSLALEKVQGAVEWRAHQHGLAHRRRGLSRA